MHEVAAVGALVDAVGSAIAAHQPCRVDAVRVRRGSTFAEEALVQAFAMLSQGTALEGARLEIETVDRTIECRCSRVTRVTTDDLVGHLWICPVCASVEDVDDLDDLTLLDVVLTGREVSASASAS